MSAKKTKPLSPRAQDEAKPTIRFIRNFTTPHCHIHDSALVESLQVPNLTVEDYNRGVVSNHFW